MVAQNATENQKRRTALAGSNPVPPPQVCPTCGRPYDLFDYDTSRLLDWIARLHEDLHHLQHAVEEVLP